LIYDFKIGIVLTESEFNKFGETINFKKSFVFKGFHQGLAHYFSSKFLTGGPRDCSKPKPVAEPIMSCSLGPLRITENLEAQLLSIEF